MRLLRYYVHLTIVNSVPVPAPALASELVGHLIGHQAQWQCWTGAALSGWRRQQLASLIRRRTDRVQAAQQKKLVYSPHCPASS